MGGIKLVREEAEAILALLSLGELVVVGMSRIELESNCCCGYQLYLGRLKTLLSFSENNSIPLMA